MYEMMAGRSPFDIVGMTDNPDENTEEYLFKVRIYIEQRRARLTKNPQLFCLLFVELKVLSKLVEFLRDI